MCLPDVAGTLPLSFIRTELFMTEPAPSLPGTTAAATTIGGKFQHPDITANGDARAQVALGALETLWFATGTLCNLACSHCYIESSPTNDRLAYLSLAEVSGYLDEIAARALPTREIGLTGGEPFMNPDILPILDTCLMRGFSVLLLSNAMRPMQRPPVKEGLLALQQRDPGRLTIRVSLDHYTQERHERERGPDSWSPAIAGLQWLSQNGFGIAVAGRSRWDEPDGNMRAGFARLFAAADINIDAADPAALVLFPEMDETADVPEITTACWDILGKRPEAMMCATSRMVVKDKGADRPHVVACTLLPYDPRFAMGETLADADGPIRLNHPHCAKFCVLGGASCSAS